MPFFSFLMWNKWSVATSVYFWINTDTLLQVWSDWNWPQFTDPTTHSWPVLHSSSEKKKNVCNLSLKYNNFLPQKQLLFLAQIKMGCGALTRWLLRSIDNVCGIMSVTMENNSVYQYNKKNKIYTPKKVKVFPALVMPYVKTREFCPSRTFLTRPFTVPSNISFCVVSGP